MVLTVLSNFANFSTETTEYAKFGDSQRYSRFESNFIQKMCWHSVSPFDTYNVHEFCHRQRSYSDKSKMCQSPLLHI